jgi:anthranilate phosphoribosyltransferase
MSGSRNLRVADAEQSKARVLEVLDGQQGPALDIVCLNAGAALYVAGVAASIGNGIERAREAIVSGRARAKLDDFLVATQRLAPISQ